MRSREETEEINGGTWRKTDQQVDNMKSRRTSSASR